jgi:hypothetical protein
MPLLWGFDLDAVAQRNLYLDRIRETENHREILVVIEQFMQTSAAVRVR